MELSFSFKPLPLTRPLLFNPIRRVVLLSEILEHPQAVISLMTTVKLKVSRNLQGWSSDSGQPAYTNPIKISYSSCINTTVVKFG